MASDRQQKQIQKLMRRIKDAKDQGKSEEVIKKRTQELYQYLYSEGLVEQYD
jgi:isopropylmalate/homocitrate/citramalate synthase